MKSDVRINNKMNERKWYHRFTAITIVMSMLCAFFVPLDLAKPAKAITSNDLNDGLDYFDGPYEGSIEGFTDYKDYVSGSFTIGQQQEIAIEGESVVIDAGAANPAAIRIEFSYELDKEEMASLLEKPYAYYQLDPALKPRNSYSGSTLSFTDPDWNGGQTIAGYYSINMDGLIVFHYTSDYINYLISSNGVKGSIYFNANVDRSESESGDQTFEFGETEVTLKFDDSKPTLQKSGSTAHEGDDYFIDWTVTIGEATGYIDMSTYSFSDALNEEQIDWSAQDFTVEPEGSMYVEGTELKFTQYAVGERPEQIVLKYRTSTALAETTKNEAELTKGEITVPASYTVTVENGLTVKKSGVPDYELSSGANDKIQWTIDVKHKSGDTLKKVKVTDENFSFGDADNVTVFGIDGKKVDSSLYTVSGNDLTFVDDPSVPSEVKIVFWGPAENNVSWDVNRVYNKAKAGRDDIPDVSDEKDVVYKHDLSLYKQLNGLNRDTGTFEWQFTLSTLRGDNIKESINGYKITDAAFAGMTQEQINAIGFNVFNGDNLLIDSQNETKSKYGFSIIKESTESDTITISFDEDAADYDKDNPLNVIKLYYKTTIQDYLSAEDWAKYQSGEEVGLFNRATAENANDTMNADSGEVGEKIQQRSDASKTYFGKTYESTIGNEDSTDRILNWSVSIVKDSGILAGDTFYDVCAADGNVPHYIAPEQRSSIINSISGVSVTGQNSSHDNAEVLTSDMYDIIFYTDSDLTQEAGDNDNAVGFKIIFKDNQTLASYHHIYIDYQTTAETSEIAFGEQVTFSNNYSFNDPDTPKTTNGLTYKREDPNDVPNIELTVSKNWNDNSNIFGNRPGNFSVKVFQAEADANGELPAEPVWVPYPDDSVHTFETSYTDNTHPYSLGTIFPKWRYDEENDKIIRYYYKIEEEPVEGYTSTIDNASVNAEYDRTFGLTNTSTTNFGKLAVDSNANRIAQANINDSRAVPIETIVIDGKPTKCYMFRWAIIMNQEPGITVTYVDTLPENAVYISGEGVDAKYHPSVYFGESPTDFYKYKNDWYIGSDSVEGDQLTLELHSNSAIQKFVYYTAIPMDKLAESVDENGKIINKVSKDGGAPYEAKLEIVGELPEPESEPIKKAAVTAGQGVIKYSIDFNPDGKNLSSIDTVDITDVLYYAEGTRKTDNGSISIPLEDLSFELESVDMFPLIDGEADESNSIKGQLGYTVEYDTTVYEQLPASAWTKEDQAGKIWRTTELSPGDKVTFKLKYKSASVANQLNLFAKKQNEYSVDDVGAVQYGHNALTIDENGILEVTMTVPDAKADIYELNDYQSAFEIMSTTIAKDAPAVLNLTVPDETPVRIVYSYRVDGWMNNATGDPENDDVLKFNNKASFESENGSGESTANDNQMNTSGAKVNALRYPTIYKTEYGNDNLDYLSASFAVAKYDTATQQWVYLNNIETITTGAGTSNEKNHREFTFPDSPYTGYLEANDKYPANTALLVFADEDDASTPNDKENVHEFDLKEGTLYKFVEITAPEGYTQPNWTDHTLTDNSSFVFYYAYDGFDEANAPAEARGKINSITAGKRINIKNSKNITVQAEKTFTGSDDKLPELSEVTLKLYWANNKKGTGMKLVTSETMDVADDFDPVRVINYDSNQDTNSASWSGLPTGYKGGAVYYFVREYSYKDKEGVLYTYDEAEGQYLNNGHEGPFKPVYTGNGTNVDETTVKINNSEGIVVKKLWVNLDGREVTPAKEVGSNSFMSVGFTVYGIKGSDRVKLVLPVTELTESNNYQYILPATVQDETGKEYSLSDFSTFEVREELTGEQMLSMEGRYLEPQTNRVIENGTGVLEIINTDMSSDTTNAIVQKVWKDGGLDHSTDTLTMMLIQSTDPNLTEEQLSQIASGSAVSGAYTGSSIRSSDNVKLIGKGDSITVTFDKNVISVAGLPEGVTETHSETRLALSGNSISSGTIIVTFEDDSTAELTVSVIDYEVTLGKQSSENAVWNYTWNDLPFSDGENNYYYYVAEKEVPEDYTVSYNRSSTSSGHKTIVTNSLPTELKVSKLWQDVNGNVIITDPETEGYDQMMAASLPDSIQIQLYQKLKDETSTPVDISMPGEDADITTQFSGVLYGTYTLKKSDGYQLSIPELPETNLQGVEFVYYVKEAGTHSLENNAAYYTLSGDSNKYINAVTYEHNGQLAADSGTVIIRNTVRTVDLNIKKIWDDDEDHSGDTITVRVHRETVADSADSQQNPLILQMNVENGSTIQLPIGNTDGITVTSNKGVNPTVEGNGVYASMDSAGKKIWKLKPKDAASYEEGAAKVGDTATITFTDDSGQTVTVNVEIVKDPELELSTDVLEYTADANDPTISPAWTLKYTPSVGSEQVLSADDENVTFRSSNTNAATIDDNGVLTVVNGGTTMITATYNNGGVAISNPVSLNIVLPAFEADDISLTIGDEPVKITVTPPYGNFTFESDDPDIASVDSEGNVTGKSKGNTTITITRTDDNRTYIVNVTVAPGAIIGTIPDKSNGNHYSYTYSPSENLLTVDLTINQGNSKPNFAAVDDLKELIPTKFEVVDGSNGVYSYVKDWGYHWNNTTVIEKSDNTLTFAQMTDDLGFWENANSNYTLKVYLSPVSDLASTQSTGVQQTRKLMTRFSSTNLRLGSALNYTSQPLETPALNAGKAKASSADFNENDYMDITLTSDNSWQKVLTGLPVYMVNDDGSVLSCYYWAEEIEINGQAVSGFTASYSFTDDDIETDYSINASEPGEAPLITIKNTPTELPTVDLPEAGGRGTRMFYLTGGAILLLSAAGYIMCRRRRVSGIR